MLNDRLCHKRQDLVSIAFQSYTKGREPGKEWEGISNKEPKDFLDLEHQGSNEFQMSPWVPKSWFYFIFLIKWHNDN